MKIYFLLVSLAAALDSHRPRRFVFAHRLADSPTLQFVQATSATKDRSVSGMCSAAQDSLGLVKESLSAGISTLAHCAQFGKDKVGAEGVYVSFSASQETCMWFKDCQCLASSSTCLGGDQWRSVAIQDIIQSSPSTVIQTTSAPISKSAIVNDPPTTKKPGTQSSESQLDCDTSSSSGLMQSFQTKCQMNQSVWTSRLIAGSTLAGVVLLVAGIFGLAFYFDKQELNALAK